MKKAEDSSALTIKQERRKLSNLLLDSVDDLCELNKQVKKQ